MKRVLATHFKEYLQKVKKMNKIIYKIYNKQINNKINKITLI